MTKRLIPLVVVLAFAGCHRSRTSTQQHPIAPWAEPPQVQRKMAEEFDPYPDNVAGPAIVGGRPRDFQVPRPEPTRARKQWWNPTCWFK